jgi:hypothetical protein
LAPKNWFGGRVLVPFELYMSLRRVYFGHDYLNRPMKMKEAHHSGRSAEQEETEDHYQLKSLLNIVADSGVVETYLITRAEMSYLPDSDLKIIFDWIV